MIPLRLVVGALRAFRLAAHQRAAEAHADGRPCCALVWWHISQDVTAFIRYLIPRRKEPTP